LTTAAGGGAATGGGTALAEDAGGTGVGGGAAASVEATGGGNGGWADAGVVFGASAGASVTVVVAVVSGVCRPDHARYAPASTSSTAAAAISGTMGEERCDVGIAEAAAGGGMTG
jgi:hypothetical protein